MTIHPNQRASEWPPAGDAARLARYHTFRLMFERRHDEAFENARRLKALAFRENDEWMYIVWNYAQLVAKCHADFLMGETPRITLAEGNDAAQPHLDALLGADAPLGRTNYLSAMHASIYGDSLYKVRLHDGRVSIAVVEPTIWYPVTDLDDRKRVTEHWLAWEREAGSGEQRAGSGERGAGSRGRGAGSGERGAEGGEQRAGSGERYLRVEIHRSGEIENRMYVLRGGEVAGSAPLPPGVEEIQETGVNAPLVFHVPNYQFSGLYGVSDLADTPPLQEELNNRLSQIAQILDKHADPYMAGPDISDDVGRVRARYKYINLEPDEHPPEYIAWEPQLEACYTEIEQLVDALHMVTETSPAAFGVRKEDQAESGRALMFRVQRTLAAARRKAMYYQPTIRRVVATAFQLANAHGVRLDPNAGETPPLRARDLVVEMRDGLPADRYENAQTEQLLIPIGASSRRAALRRLNPDWSADDIENELAEIRSEEISATGTENFGGGLAV